MREALGYFYVTDKGLYYISVELTVRSKERKIYRAMAYDVKERRFLYSDIVPARSAEKLAEALENLVSSMAVREKSE